VLNYLKKSVSHRVFIELLVRALCYRHMLHIALNFWPRSHRAKPLNGHSDLIFASSLSTNIRHPSYSCHLYHFSFQPHNERQSCLDTVTHVARVSPHFTQTVPSSRSCVGAGCCLGSNKLCASDLTGRNTDTLWTTLGLFKACETYFFIH
jgi:hypothetical protein